MCDVHHASTAGKSTSQVIYITTSWALEACISLTVVLVTLLYTPLSDNNILAKYGVLQVLTGAVVVLSCILVALNRRLRLLRLPLYLPLLAFSLVSLVSARFSQNPGLGIESTFSLAAMFAISLVVAHYYRASSRLDRLFWVLALTNVVVSSLGLLQCLGIDPLGVVEKYRLIPVSTLGNPNSAAHYHELMLPVLAAALASRWRTDGRLLRGVLLFAVLAAAAHLLAAESRAGWLSVAAVLPLLFLLTTRMTRLPGNAPVYAVIAILLIPISGLVMRRIPLPGGENLEVHAARAIRQTLDRALTVFDRSDYTRSMRALIWRETVEMISASPVLGVGPGQYRASLPAYSDRGAWRDLAGQTRYEPRRAHNEYLHFAAEAGLLGLAAMVWLLGSLLWTGVRILRSLPRSDPEGRIDRGRAMTAGILCGIVASLLHACVSFNLHDPVSSLHFWLLGGVMVGLSGRPPDADNHMVDVGIHGPVRLAGTAAVCICGAFIFGQTGLRILLGDYHYARGNEILSAGRVEPSIVAFHRATGWRGHDPSYHHTIGQAAVTAGHSLVARASLQRCLSLSPNRAAAMRLLGRLLVRGGEDHDAIEVLTRALAIDRFHAPTHALLAQAYRQAGRPDLAKVALGQGLQVMPYDPELLAAMALAHREAGDMEKCVSLLNQAARLSPRDARIAGNLGSAHLALGNLNRAETHLRRALRLDSRNREVWQANLADALLQQSRALRLRNRHVEAQLAAEEALRLAPKSEVAQEVRRITHRPR